MNKRSRKRQAILGREKSMYKFKQVYVRGHWTSLLWDPRPGSFEIWSVLPPYRNPWTR